MQLVLLVEFVVSSAFAERFGELVLANARASLEEAGCRRFDVLVEPPDTRRFVLYEIYDDDDAFELHLRSSHFHSFAAAIDGHIEKRSLRRLRFHVPPPELRNTA